MSDDMPSLVERFCDCRGLGARIVEDAEQAAVVEYIDRLRTELAEAKDYARSLAVVLHRDHYADVPQFEPFDDLMGLLSQIDNMITGWKPEYGGQPSQDSIVAELKKFNAWRKGEIHEWNVGMHSGPDPREISALIDRAIAMLAAAKAERDHATRRAETLHDGLATETARADDFTHGYMELRAGIALCLYFGRLAEAKAQRYAGASHTVKIAEGANLDAGCVRAGAANYGNGPWPWRDAQRVPDCFMRLYEHAYGMSVGIDWNKGTQAGFHREPLMRAVEECKAMLAAAKEGK